jgi:Domain of unknown function (DUF4397)
MNRLILSFIFFVLAAFVLQAQAPTARVQIIHNAPTPTVDIYAGTAKLLDNFAFRTATPFIDVPAGDVIAIGVALGNSASSADAIATFPVKFDAGKTYVVVATGIVGGTPGFTLKVFDAGKETAAAGNVGILFFHGSPDAPTVDVVTGGQTLINDASYTDFKGYLEVPAASYDLSVKPGADTTTVASYRADLSFWNGKTAVIFASGFLTGGKEPGFEPWVALSNGGTFPLKTLKAPPAPPVSTTMARVQIIHNAPTPTVDIYAGTAKLLDNFAFRTATPFIDVPAGVEIPIGVALGTSTASTDAIATFPVKFDAGKTYVVVATGIVGGTPGFTLRVFDMGAEKADKADNVGILFFHGSPDAPTVDVVTGGQPLINDASYGDFKGYLNVPAASYDLSVTPGANNSNVLAKYKADLSFWKGKTAVIFASGFLGAGKTPGFEPWVALSNGGTFPLPAIPMLQNENVEDRGIVASELRMYPNPTADRFQVNFRVEADTDVQALIVNSLGQAAETRNLGILAKGAHLLDFDAAALPVGNYYLTLRSADRVQTLPFSVAR